MKRKYKIGIIIILLVVILSLLVYSCIKLTRSDDKKEVAKFDSIPSYGYSLDKRDTKLMKDEFKELKKILKFFFQYMKNHVIMTVEEFRRV